MKFSAIFILAVTYTTYALVPPTGTNTDGVLVKVIPLHSSVHDIPLMHIIHYYSANMSLCAPAPQTRLHILLRHPALRVPPSL